MLFLLLYAFRTISRDRYFNKLCLPYWEVAQWISSLCYPEVELARSFSKDSFAGCGILGWQVFSPLLFSTFNM